MFRLRTIQVFLVGASTALLYLLLSAAVARAGEPKAAWQVEWEMTLKAAEMEGEVAVYVVDYPKFTVDHFQKAYPKIKLSVVDGRPERP